MCSGPHRGRLWRQEFWKLINHTDSSIHQIHYVLIRHTFWHYSPSPAAEASSQLLLFNAACCWDIVPLSSFGCRHERSNDSVPVKPTGYLEVGGLGDPETGRLTWQI